MRCKRGSERAVYVGSLCEVFAVVMLEGCQMYSACKVYCCSVLLLNSFILQMVHKFRKRMGNKIVYMYYLLNVSVFVITRL